MAKTPWQTIAAWAMGERGGRRARMTNITNEQLTAFAAYLRDHPMAHNPAGVFHNRFTGRARLSMGVVKDEDSAITWDARSMEQARP